jgi:aryl-alcohol dehydrogenase-like predicted oxidoreductase
MQPPIIPTPDVPNIFQGRVTPAAVEAAVRKSAAALRVPRLDLVQLVGGGWVCCF